MTVLTPTPASDLGRLPAGWSWTQLGKIGESFIGLTYSPKNVSRSGTLVLRSSNVEDGALKFDDNVFVKMSVPDRALVRKDDILICARNGSRALIGKCAKIDERAARMAFGAFMAVFRTADHGIVFYNLQSDAMRRQIEAHLGATINQITNASLNGFWVPYPQAHDERTAIADALSNVDARLTGLNQLIARRRDLKQAAMQELLSGRTRLPGFQDAWRGATIGDVADVKTGPFGSSLHESDYVEAGTPIITVEHLGERSITLQNLPLVSDEDYRRLRAYSLEAGDVVFSRVGSVDRNALVTDAESGWLFSGRLLRVRIKRGRADPAFLSHQFHSEPFKQRVREVAVGQTMPSLNTQILRRLPVALPSLAEQRAIARVLSDMDAELAALETRRDKTRQLKQGMMQGLLTGRIRLT